MLTVSGFICYYFFGRGYLLLNVNSQKTLKWLFTVDNSHKRKNGYLQLTVTSHFHVFRLLTVSLLYKRRIFLFWF